MSKILIIDGNSLLFRAYYAMTVPMVTKEGIYTQGIYSFINMINKLKEDFSPTHMMVAFDVKGPTFRHLEYEEYKAGRKKTPDELLMEIPILHDVLDAMNIKIIEISGYEADDVIGTVACKADETGMETYIVTGDKDALQLVTDNINIVINKKGVTQFETYDLNKMEEVYGLTPSEFIDLKGLMGDKSDNIPGVPGIGIKTGTNLLKEFGTVENIVENADEIKKERIKNLIKENSDSAIMSKRLATIEKSVPIDIDFDEMILKNPNMDELVPIYQKLEFNSFLKRLDIGESKEKVEIDTDNIKVLTDINLLNKIENNSVAVIKVLGDKNHVTKPNVTAVMLLTNKYFYYLTDDIYKIVNELNKKSLSLIGHELKEDLYQLMYFGYDNFELGFDTKIAMYLLEPTRSKYLIDKISLTNLGIEIVAEEEFQKNNQQVDLFGNFDNKNIEYYKEYLSVIKLVKDSLILSIKEFELDNVLFECELPLIRVMAEMELNGIKTDKDVLNEIGKSLNAKIAELKNNIIDLAGEDFNINSPKQLGIILFDKLGLPPYKKTKSGYSTNVDVLEKLKDKHPIIKYILEYRTYSKLNSTYVEGLLPLIGTDGRTHPHFNQTITSTGRISCNEPNLQNIPIRNEYGRNLRKAFVVSDENKVFIGADYSQIELRVLAHLSKDQELIDAFNRGDDIHRLTASRVFEIPYDSVEAIDRSRAKAVNFGVIYGMSGFGLSEELNISMKQAKDYIDEYFNKHPDVKNYMDTMKMEGKNKGYVTTILGRKRWLPELNSPKFMTRQMGERLAMNTPIQGSAADVIKLAMVKVNEEIKDRGLKSKLILQIHDELIIEAEKSEEEVVVDLLVSNMMNAINMSVKLLCDVNKGNSWYELK
ncbi:MAG TPA: DNA polymerase I [Anaerovoracaceae bacterium]|nr:DNA polymerase I [Anaerovoracaceae bacterium]